MPAKFYRKSIEDNTWNPEVCAVDMRERMAAKIAKWAEDTELFTVWIEVEDDEVGEGYVEQVTQDNCRVFISELDDDSDTISYLDRRDGMWFSWMRATHGDSFDEIARAVIPWAVYSHSIAPQQQVYQKFLDFATMDMGDNFTIPDDWS